MKSGEAHNLMKAAGQRNVLWEGQVTRQAKRGQEVKPVETDRVQEGTDYKPRPNLANIPLSARARNLTTPQGALNRQIHASVLPESRNVGNTIWRRYPNGSLDTRDAVSKLREALRRFRTGAPLNETDALTISSVYPEYKFKELPKETVSRKAFLSTEERNAMQQRNVELENDEALRAVVDLGGA